jgi:excisionase family DNA binding protein
MNEGLTTKEVSQILGVSIRTVQSYVKEGRLTARKDMKGRNRFDKAEVLALKGVHSASSEPSYEESRALQVDYEVSSPYDPELHVLIDRMAYEDLMQKYEKLLMDFGSLRNEHVRLLEYKGETEAQKQELSESRARIAQIEAEKERLLKEAEFKVVQANEVVLTKEQELAGIQSRLAEVEAQNQKLLEEKKRVQEGLLGRARETQPAGRPWWKKLFGG